MPKMMSQVLARCLGFVVPCLVVIGLSLSVSACGKRGNPKPPENKPVSFPKSYPTK
jgi:hypothetical protein